MWFEFVHLNQYEVVHMNQYIYSDVTIVNCGWVVEISLA
jgi:hypothetical protein